MNKKRVFNSIIMMVMVVVGVLVTSCNNDDEFAPQSSTSEYSSDFSKSAPLKAASRAEYRATQYCVNQKYKDEYSHYKQKQGECSWTSYVLAVSAIVRGKGDFRYPYNGDYYGKISHVKSTRGGSSVITKLDDYCKKQDKPKYSITSWYRHVPKDDTDGALDILLDHRAYNDTPILYIGKVGSIGHYLIIWDVEWTGDESTSTVWYTDVNEDLVNGSRSYYDNVRSRTIASLFSLNIMNNHNFLCLY